MLIRTPETIRGYDSISQNYSYIKQKMDNDFNANQTIWNKYWLEGTRDNNLEAGISYNTQNYAQPLNNNNTPWYFNRVRPLLNQVSGWQRKTRKSSIVVPLEGGDQETADQWTKILLHIYNKEGLYETISDAFHQGALITGMNLLHVYLDFKDDDISGEIKIDNLAYNQFFIDPYFRKHDLSDCQFVWRRTYVNHQQAAALMPQQYDAIMALPGNPTGTGRDGRFQYVPEAFGQAGRNLLAYDEYYYRDFRKQKKLIDKQTGEGIDVTDQPKEMVDAFLDENPSVYLQEKDIPTVRLAIQIQGRVFYDGPQPSGSDLLPFVPIIGYYNPSLPVFSARIQGLCRSLRDPQSLYNRRLILSMDYCESVVNTGWKFKEGAPLDVLHLLQTGQGRLIPIKKGFELQDIEQIAGPNVPPSFFQLQEILGNEMNYVTGVTPENMGLVEDNQSSGFKVSMKQHAGMTALEPVFDRLNFSQNLTSNIIMDLARRNYTPYKIMEMLEGEEPAPLFFNKAFGKYHAMVEQGYDTETQKQLQFAQMMTLREAGVPISNKDVIEAATLQNKNRVIANMEQEAQQAMQQQQQMQQAAQQEQEARTALAYARAGADEGLEIERKARAVSDKAMAIQKLSEASKEEELALLNKIKVLKEIESVDFEHLAKLISIAKIMKNEERSETPQLAS